MHTFRLGLGCLIIAMLLATPTRSVQAQTRIDSSFEFEGAAKPYSIYVPSGYSAEVPSKMVLAFHPFHQVWGNAGTWCDILTDFAEMNNLLLVCPDGGPDLRIDDAIDTAFSAALLDSTATWYNVNADKRFIVAFSWGARAAYNWGLDHADWFAGYMTIGAFINGAAVTPTQLANSENKPFYIMHGDADGTAPINVGFHPIRNALANAGALVESRILAGVGHTINFPDRDAILTTAFNWLDSTSTGLSVAIEEDVLPHPGNAGLLQPNYPNPFSGSTTISYAVREPSMVQLRVYNLTGQLTTTLVSQEKAPGNYTAVWDGRDEHGRRLPVGVYFSTLSLDGGASGTMPLVLVR